MPNFENWTKVNFSSLFSLFEGAPRGQPRGIPRGHPAGLFKITLAGTVAKAKDNEELVQKAGIVKQ